jgi:hypothetical protein
MQSSYNGPYNPEPKTSCTAAAEQNEHLQLIKHPKCTYPSWTHSTDAQLKVYIYTHARTRTHARTHTQAWAVDGCIMVINAEQYLEKRPENSCSNML